MDAHPVRLDNMYPNVGIYSFGKGLFQKSPIDGASTSAQTLYRIKSGQVIYSRLFAFEGAYGVVPAEFDGAYVSNEFPTLDVRTARALPAYVGWVLRRPETWRALAQLGTGMGDRRKRIHPEQLLSFRIPLPPLSDQNAVVSRLNAAGACVAKRATLASLIQAECDALLQNEFARSIESAPLLPMGRVAPLVRRPVKVTSDGRYPELGIRSFGKGTFHKPTLSGSDVGTKRIFEIHAGDLLFSNVFAWEGAVAVATAADHGRFGSHRFITCVADGERVTPSFLQFWFSTPTGLEQLRIASPGGAGRNHTLGLEGLASLQVPIPNRDAQVHFARLCGKVDQMREAQLEASSLATQVIPALLHASFGSGIIESG